MSKGYVDLAMGVINHASQTMSSLQIAEITGKRHDAVLRDVRNILEQGVDAHNFVETSYTDKSNRQSPCFMLTKTGCLILASGYNALLREKIINRWIELETADQPKVPTTFREALLLAAAQQEQIEQQQKLLAAQSQTIIDLNEVNAEMRVKVSYYDQILASKSTVTTTQIAQDYGMSAKKFNIILRNLKIQRKVGGQWILYAPHNTMGYVHSDTFIPDNSISGKVVMTTKWTQKGRLFLYETLKRNNILPTIERAA